MTKEEYKNVCEEIGIKFYDTDEIATPEQLCIKAQLVRKYYPNYMMFYRSATSELIIGTNNKVINVFFPNDDFAVIFWMRAPHPNFTPILEDIKKTSLGFGFFAYNQIVSTIEKIVNGSLIYVGCGNQK